MIRNTVLICTLTFFIPMASIAAENNIPSNVHLFQTTYDNGATRDGFVAVTSNRIRLSLSPDGQFGNIPSQSNPTNDDMIFFKDRKEMIYITHEDQSYGVMNAETMEAMKQQRDEMMSGLGITPGSGQDEELMKAFGDAMKQVQDARRQGMEKAQQDQNMSAEDRRRMDELMKRNFPKSTDYDVLKVTKTGKKEKENGIACEWYQLVASGVRHICVADWDDVPRGQQTKQMFHAWYDFMESLTKGLPFKNNPYEEFKQIDGFPLITIVKDEDGNSLSEQRYKGTEKRNISYVPPAGYSSESHFVGENRKKPRRDRGFKNPTTPQAHGGSTKKEEGECVLTEKGIICK